MFVRLSEKEKQQRISALRTTLTNAETVERLRRELNAANNRIRELETEVLTKSDPLTKKPLGNLWPQT